ncbi:MULTISPECIES: YbaK/EbsC family protein [unclassified Streptomyces]|uniref:YbaK/EbsC family protein n=1 Tax=unclassified Streptomyces TaxID=2593676 RepID=UPI00190C09E6|nr:MULTISPECIES: YbaK/EbsC family protein [unclassified Streptomyces]MBK3568485.1 YbaK/prolyl-tRNA synthetase associated domain-containing protein [Streptomyces sp. MBT62]MBK6015431.1 YbaK/prolyl-tRNA synthetase associated domain-containing protein [Streptomyces sp. MBT53]
MAADDADGTYGKLLALLDEHGAAYRVIEHAPEGGTEAVSRLRGHALDQAAKCIIVMVKIGKKEKRHALVVVPGDKRIDLPAVKALYGGSYASFASPDVAEELAKSPSGTILPFSFDDRLELIVDPGLLNHPEFYFNAARLDRSLALSTDAYRSIAEPRVEPVSLD